MDYFDGDLVHEAALPGLTGFIKNDNIIEPNTNVYSFGDKFILKLEMPGIFETDVNMVIDDDNELTITCKREIKHASTDILLKEYKNCVFKRSLTVPKGTTLNDIETEYINGIFIVFVP